MAFGIPDKERQPTRRETVSAPPPGSYGGTVNGHHAVFGVTSDVVTAWWIRRDSLGAFRQENSAWDIYDGRFLPRQGSWGEELAKVRIRLPRKDAPPEG